MPISNSYLFRGTFLMGAALTALCSQAACQVDPEDVPSDRAPLPVAANAVAAAVHGDELYVYGGHVGSAHDQSRDHTLTQFIRLDLTDAEAEWETLSDLPEPIQQGSLFSHEGSLYRLGGMTSLNPADEEIEIWSRDLFERYDEEREEWVALVSMPDTRASHSLTIVDNVIYIMGGWTLHGESGSGVYSETFMRLDLNSDPLTWEEIEQPFQIRDHCAGTVDGKVYVLGGMLSGTFPPTPWIFDPATDEWSRGPDVPSAGIGVFGGFGCAAASANDTIYFSASETLYAMNANRDGWDEVSPLAAPRIFHQMVVHDDEVILLGGGVGTDVTPLDSVETVPLN